MKKFLQKLFGRLPSYYHYTSHFRSIRVFKDDLTIWESEDYGHQKDEIIDWLAKGYTAAWIYQKYLINPNKKTSEFAGFCLRNPFVYAGPHFEGVMLFNPRKEDCKEINLIK